MAAGRPWRNSFDVADGSDGALPVPAILSDGHPGAAGESTADETERLRRRIQKLSFTFHGLSHDLREPIRALVCYGEILARSEAIRTDPNLAESLHFITGATRRIDELVTGLLGYSQVLSEDVHPPAKVDMNLVVQTALANLHMKIEESGATVVNDNLPPVMGDSVQLVELVQNLLGNSIKYRSAAPPQILITCEPGTGEQVFCIEDNGIGIEPEYRDSIFMPFKRLHGRELPGAGLGLTICQHIVDVHRGRIWLESTPGKGSAFRFTLPAAID